MEFNFKMISELGRVITGKTPPTENADFFDGNYPFITPSDIHTYDEKYLAETERSISENGAKKLKGLCLPPRSICFVCIGSTIGKMCMTNKHAFSNQQINALIPSTEYDCDYVFYFLRYIRSYFQSIGGGTGSGKGIVNKTLFSKTRINILKDKANQQRIGAILSAYDNLIEVNNKRIKALEQMAENLYKEWFVRFRFPGHETAEFEDGIPKGWDYRPLDSLAFVTMGQSPESQYYNYDSIGLPFHQGVGSYGEYYLVDDMYSSQGARIAEPNSIIFSVRAPVGRINLTLNRIILGRGVAGINSKEGKNWFLLYMLKHRFAAEDLIGNGSIFSSVKKEELLKQKFLVPSSALISKYDSTARKIEWQIRLAYLSNKNLIKQRDLLLPRLMSGKLEV